MLVPDWLGEILKPINRILDWVFKDRRKVLPYKEVVIGTFTMNNLNVKIKADIFLNENVKPNDEIFLGRISIGKPYCPDCLQPLSLLSAGWMGDGLQIGYKCVKCTTEIRKDDDAIRAEVIGEVRRNYGQYWTEYRSEILALTKGKPKKSKLE